MKFDNSPPKRKKGASEAETDGQDFGQLQSGYELLIIDQHFVNSIAIDSVLNIYNDKNISVSFSYDRILLRWQTSGSRVISIGRQKRIY